MQSFRLNTNQFLALRSIARESWDLNWGRIQWRFNGKWFHLFRDYGVRAPLGSVDGIGGRCGHEDVFERAWDAALELEARGMVEVFTVRCCPGSSCHTNDRHEFRLTPMGSALLQKANAASLQANVDKKSATEGTPVSEDTPQASWWHKAMLLLPWRRPDVTRSEKERLKMERDYFESGCACIASGKLEPQPSGVNDKDAVAFYTANCTCTRNTK